VIVHYLKQVDAFHF